VIFSNNGTLAGHVLVEDYAVIGGLSGVHQFCRIGRHAIVGGCTKIVQDVPPYMIADGNPAEIRGVNQVGLERRGFAKRSSHPSDGRRQVVQATAKGRRAVDDIMPVFNKHEAIVTEGLTDEAREQLSHHLRTVLRTLDALDQDV
jgi:UDP-N-acetylglucosamine acyltransferase